jgi:hypothetical protein
MSGLIGYAMGTRLVCLRTSEQCNASAVPTICIASGAEANLVDACFLLILHLVEHCFLFDRTKRIYCTTTAISNASSAPLPILYRGCGGDCHREILFQISFLKICWATPTKTKLVPTVTGSLLCELQVQCSLLITNMIRTNELFHK